LIDAMEADFGSPIGEMKADGGAAANSFLMQFQADVLGRTVVLPEANEITALGAAYLAGLAVGYWESERDIALNWRARRRFEPSLIEKDREALVARWRKAVAAARSFTA
jgi:glycerol kinase